MRQPIGHACHRSWSLDVNSALRVELDKQDLRCRGAALKWLQARGVVIVRLVSANLDHILGSPPSDAKTTAGGWRECVCGLPVSLTLIGVVWRALSIHQLKANGFAVQLLHDTFSFS